ncbi:3'-5' ssDNA/RNA exonuclease TatD-like [Diadema setosum]|uniref:3'-5' ssDNA/RNA exonuclease TatD-like n=1 Tax=Diadema setosum TaxID=31175 RepID=UPI003B3B5F7C
MDRVVATQDRGNTWKLALGIHPKNASTFTDQHCGDSLQVRAWTARFPHCYFGVSALVRSLSDPQRTAVREIPLDHLLLEIDAPHLAPHPGMHYNMLRFLGDMGRLVADIRGLPLAWLMAVTTANAQCLYGY